ncbi:MAG: sugar ABC transporter ATP-binding protein [Anaerolineae bacterium]|nr:sugar ABC transporter ATP-binding protein [Anaerolineae bacterium]
MEQDCLLELSGITKQYPGILALDHVDFSLELGEIHGLVGENGAGKSTLIKILNGVAIPDDGVISLDGVPQVIANPRDSAALGMAFIHQEPTLFPNLSVAENLFAGHPRLNRWGLVSKTEQMQAARQLLARMNLEIDPSALVGDIRLAEAQMVEILRAISLDARILVMDEPTSSLTESEKHSLFKLIESLKAEGVSIIYVSHFLDEVLAICDRITVLKDGKKVSTHQAKEITKSDLILKMVGHGLEVGEGQSQSHAGDTILSVRALTVHDVLHDITFDLRRGEIVGICGLLGAGKTELAKALFGLLRYDSGTVVIDGEAVHVRSPRDVIRRGMGFVTESRLVEGIIGGLSVRENATVTLFDRLSNWLGLLDRGQQRQMTGEMVADLGVRAASQEQHIMYLSGGNQQKVVLGKWLLLNSTILILDEPTRGIDIGAKREIYRILQRLAGEGTSILLISSEIDEVYDLSDRIFVMYDGRISRQIARGEVTRNELIALVTESISLET